MNGRTLHSVDSDNDENHTGLCISCISLCEINVTSDLVEMYSIDEDEDENHTAIVADGYLVADPPELSNDIFNVLLESLSS